MLLTGAILGALAVIIGAFGAHGVKPHLSPTQYSAYQTGSQYHFYHTLIIVINAVAFPYLKPKFSIFAFYFFTFGILCFSGSLYLLSTRDLLGISSWSWLGPITPIGGICFILGWLFLGIAAIKYHPNTHD